MKPRKHSHVRRAKTQDYEAESNRTLASLCNLSIAQVADFREIFRQIDLDNNGSIDEKELKQLLKSIHSDEQLCSEDFVRDLMARVKGVQNKPKDEANEDDSSLEFTFEELMLSILKRPQVDYTKDDVLKAFSVLSGTSGTSGLINTEKLARAIEYGNGGISKADAEDIMSMLEHSPSACFDYVELCDLLMGHRVEKKHNVDEKAQVMMEHVVKPGKRKGTNVTFMVPKHILEQGGGNRSPKKPKSGTKASTAKLQLKKSVSNIKKLKSLTSTVESGGDGNQSHGHNTEESNHDRHNTNTKSSKSSKSGKSGRNKRASQQDVKLPSL
mmetsp:Transcript_18978/g.31707  ORF Transcript_18978/g.31707 Transcript_18978/m.31707 type:complete len:327 (-) Transcript_18978:252-1232(-)